VAEVKSSITQGGPVSYFVTAADLSLRPVRTGNYLFNDADDTHLAVPASNTSSRQNEIEYIEQWTDHITTI